VVIIGGGLSGLSVAHFIKKIKPQYDVIVVERASRAGGAIQSLREQGFLAEWGAHGFLDNVAESQELLADLMVDQDVLKAPLKQFRRYISLKGRLVPLPQSPGQVINGRYMPFWGKVRILADLWKRPLEAEQTVAQWANYRFGGAILPIVDAAVTGTYSGDMERLSIDAVMPGLRRMEFETGSILRGAVKMMRQGSADGKSSGIPCMVSFKQGVERLIEALAANSHLSLGTTVQGLTQTDSGESGWRIETDKGSIRARQVVLALQINQALALLSGLEPPPIKHIPEARLINVVMGFTPGPEIPYAFGYLAPRRENRFALGALFSSHMFPGRTPEGGTLLETLIGRRCYPERVDLEDSELIDKAYQDIRQLLHLPNDPCFVRVLRPEVGIPQLELGHNEIIQWRDRLEERFPGLYACGFGWEGIGINDMVKKAKAVALALAAGKSRSSVEAKAKGVYF